jgi:hypothetical protein
MQPYNPRQQVNGQMMCPMCAQNESHRMANQFPPRFAVRHGQGGLSKQASNEQRLAHFVAFDQPRIVRIAHDSGDSSTIFHCFAGETRYLTREGVKTLAETVGTVQEVMTSDDPANPHSGRWVPAIIHEFGRQKLWAVTLQRNKVTKIIRATADHRWLVTTGPQRDRHRVVVTSDLRSGYRLPHLRLPQVSVEPDHEAIRMGFVFGDGTILQRVNQTYGAVILWGHKRDLSKYFDEVCATSPKERFTGNGVPGLAYTSGMIGYTKTLPPLGAAPEYLRGWLMGYFAADGSITATNTSISSSSLETLLHVRDIATLLGVGTFAPTSKWRKGFGEQETQIHQMGFSTKDLDATFFLRDDQRAIFEAKATNVERFGWTVTSVEETEVEETVYCPRVPGTETFVLEDNIWCPNCPFCGSGQVIARSDGGVECEFCHASFTVQVQPQFSAFPQSIGGMPIDVPGMGPDEGMAPPQDLAPGAQPPGAGEVPGDGGPVPPGAQGGAESQPGEEEDPQEETDEDEGDDNPFASKSKTSSYRTHTGATLDRDSYMRYLALQHAGNRDLVLAQIRAENGKESR